LERELTEWYREGKIKVCRTEGTCKQSFSSNIPKSGGEGIKGTSGQLEKKKSSETSVQSLLKPVKPRMFGEQGRNGKDKKTLKAEREEKMRGILWEFGKGMGHRDVGKRP